MVPPVHTAAYRDWRKGAELKEIADIGDKLCDKQDGRDEALIGPVLERWVFGQDTWTIARVLNVPEPMIDNIISADLDARHGGEGRG